MLNEQIPKIIHLQETNMAKFCPLETGRHIMKLLPLRCEYKSGVKLEVTYNGRYSPLTMLVHRVITLL